MPCELSLSYDADLRPISGKCTLCGEPMPTPPPELTSDADRMMWLSGHFIDHKRLKHPHPHSPDDSQ